MIIEDDDGTEITYKLSLNDMTDILNANIKNKGMEGYRVCVATHVKTEIMTYVVFKDRFPIYQSQQAEAVGIFLDLTKFNDECDENDKKSSHSSNSSRTSRLRNRRN
ncbi:MAG: hypothetical protein PHN69_03565 [Candidatus Pacebacteria bacterium]|nr:hypothetical protein [Candidatus Paceibacterota bacterium]